MGQRAIPCSGPVWSARIQIAATMILTYINAGSGFGGGGRKARSRGSDIGARLEISFKEAAFGVKKEIEYPVDDICEKCGGKGAENDDDIETCRQCGGAGKVRVTRQTFIGNVITTSTCDSCGGSGKIIKKNICCVFLKKWMCKYPIEKLYIIEEHNKRVTIH